MGALLAQPDLESLINTRDRVTGVYRDPYSTAQDRHHLSLLLHKYSSLRWQDTGLEALYSHRLGPVWPQAFIEYASIKIDAKKESTRIRLTGVGVGVMSRSTWVRHMIESDRVFTSTAVFGCYYPSHHGIGLRASFGLFWRVSAEMHYGMKFNYQLAQLFGIPSRPILTRPSFGVDVGFYF